MIPQTAPSSHSSHRPASELCFAAPTRKLIWQVSEIVGHEYEYLDDLCHLVYFDMFYEQNSIQNCWRIPGNKICELPKFLTLYQKLKRCCHQDWHFLTRFCFYNDSGHFKLNISYPDVSYGNDMYSMSKLKVIFQDPGLYPLNLFFYHDNVWDQVYPKYRMTVSLRLIRLTAKIHTFSVQRKECETGTKPSCTIEGDRVGKINLPPCPQCRVEWNQHSLQPDVQVSESAGEMVVHRGQ